MFMCDVTKTPLYARNFVYSELLFIIPPQNEVLGGYTVYTPRKTKF